MRDPTKVIWTLEFYRNLYIWEITILLSMVALWLILLWSWSIFDICRSLVRWLRNR